jgi:DNA-binding SARP family transcriptional activator
VGLEYSVLGDVTVTSSGRDVRLGSPQQKATLAFLLLRNGELISAEEICHGIWGPRLPTSAVGTIRTYIYRLRQAFSDDGMARCPIGTRSGGYRIKVVPESVDLKVFDGKVGQFRAARAAGYLPAAARVAHEALSLWRGRAFGGATGEFIDRERERLDDLRLTVTQERISLDLELGWHRELVPELMALTGRHPLREGFWELLMLALYRSGRQADSLATYREVHQLLGAEIGIEPGLGLQELHQKILKADPQLGPAVVADRAPASRVSEGTAKSERELRLEASDDDSAGDPAERVENEHDTASWENRAMPAQLPVDVIPFVGRRKEIGRISSALLDQDGPRFVGISGMPGIGKTALAVHVGHRLADWFPEGQLFIEFGRPAGSVTEPYPVLHELIRILDPDAGSLPSDLPGLSARWRSMVSRKRLLIIIDGVETPDRSRASCQPHLAVPSASPARRTFAVSRMCRGITSDRWTNLTPPNYWPNSSGKSDSRGHGKHVRDCCATVPVCPTPSGSRRSACVRSQPGRSRRSVSSCGRDCTEVSRTTLMPGS